MWEKYAKMAASSFLPGSFLAEGTYCIKGPHFRLIFEIANGGQNKPSKPTVEIQIDKQRIYVIWKAKPRECGMNRGLN